MSAFNGIEVYVWQMAENSYSCGLIDGTNCEKTTEEILSLQEKPLSVAEAKAILNELGADEKDIVVIPIVQPISSYFYEIDDELTERVTKLFVPVSES